MTQVPPMNTDAEESVLGACMVTNTLGAVLGETQLAAEHFYRERHRVIYRALVSLEDAGKPIDAITVAAELEGKGRLASAGGADAVAHLASTVGAPGNALHYASLVVEAAMWRQRLDASRLIREAVNERDEDKLAEAGALLSEEIVHADAIYDVDRRRELLWALLEGRAKAEFTWAFPSLDTATAGGLRRKQLIVISGYRGDGKSQYADQILDANRKRGFRCALYDNEMTPEEREGRTVVRHVGGISYRRLMEGRLESDDQARVLERINRGTLPDWPIVEIPGWRAEEVCHHIRRNRWDFVVVDILHNFLTAAKEKTQALDAILATFKSTAGQANCCIVLLAHVGRGGIEKGKPRAPVCSDLAWSSMIENLAHAVCFVYRRRATDVHPPKVLADGHIYLDKNRTGANRSQPVHFNEDRLRFESRSA